MAQAITAAGDKTSEKISESPEIGPRSVRSGDRGRLPTRRTGHTVAAKYGGPLGESGRERGRSPGEDGGAARARVVLPLCPQK